MKNIIIKIAFICFASMWIGSCIDSGVDPTTMKDVKFTTPVTASVSSLEVVDTSSKITFAWGVADYGANAKNVTYELQIDVPASSPLWARATVVKVDSASFSKTLNGQEISEIAAGLGLSSTACGTMLVRVHASLDRDAYSDPITICVKPIPIEVATFPGGVLFVAMESNGYKFDSTTALLDSLPDGYGGYFYEGYMWVPEPGKFKITDAPNLSKHVYLDGGPTEGIDPASVDAVNDLKSDGSGVEMEFPEAGYYRIQVKSDKSTFHLFKVVWGVAGNCFENREDGWLINTKAMTYDPATKKWSLTADMVKEYTNDAFETVATEYKFRALTDKGNVSGWYCAIGFDTGLNSFQRGEDFPLWAYKAQATLKPAEDGNYTITLDVSDAKDIKVTVTKN